MISIPCTHLLLEQSFNLFQKYGRASSGSVSIEYALLAASMLGGIMVGAYQVKDDLNSGYNEVSDIIAKYPRTVNAEPRNTDKPANDSTPDTMPSDNTYTRSSEVVSLITPQYSNLDGINASSSSVGAENLYTFDVEYDPYSGHANDSVSVMNENTQLGSTNDNQVYVVDSDENNTHAKADLIFEITAEDQVPHVISFDLKQRGFHADSSNSYDKTTSRCSNHGDDICNVADSDGGSIVSIYFGGELIDKIEPSDQWQTYSYAILGNGQAQELIFFEADIEKNSINAVMIDNIYAESGEFINGGPEMTFSETNATDTVTVTFGDLSGQMINKEGLAPASDV